MAGNPLVRFPRRVLHCDLDPAKKPPALNPYTHTLETKTKMKTTLSTTEAAHRLIDDENANWTRAGAFALCEYLEELEEDTGEEFEFCACSIRCDFSEYSDLEEWATEQFRSHVDGVDELGLTLGDDGKIEQSSEEINEAIREYIQDRGTLLEFDGGIIVSSF